MKENEYKPIYKTVKEVSQMYPLLSINLIYELIKSDPTFPCYNVGVRRKFIVDISSLDNWIKARAAKEEELPKKLIDVNDLLRI